MELKKLRRMTMREVFISHSSKDISFVEGVLIPYLREHGVDTWFSPQDVRTADEWHRKIVHALRRCDWFMVVLSPASTASEWVQAEVHWAMEHRRGQFVPVLLADCDTDELHLKLRRIQFVDFRSDYDAGRASLRSFLGKQVASSPLDADGAIGAVCDVALAFSLTLEQAIVERFFRSDHGRETADSLVWPEPTQRDLNQWTENRLFAKEDPEQLSLPDNLVLDADLGLPLRSPDGTARFVRAQCPARIPYYTLGASCSNVAILVSGGLVPGINALIDAIVRRQWEYAERHGHQDELRIFGLHGGFSAFDDYHNSYSLLTTREIGFENEIVTSRCAKQGGSIIGTSRANLTESREFARVIQMLRDEMIRVLYVLGGDGSMRAAHALCKAANHSVSEDPIAIVGVPKSVNNDILWVSPSLGSQSTSREAQRAIEMIHTEVRSNPRVCLVQLFGPSGQMVCQAVENCGPDICDVVLISECPYTIGGLARHIAKRVKSNGHAVVVMAEGAIPMDSGEILSRWEQEVGLTEEETDSIRNIANHKRQMFVSTSINDCLRSAAVNLVSRGLGLQLRACHSGVGRHSSLYQ